MPLILTTALAFLKRIPWWAFVAVAAVAAAWWLIADDRHYRAKTAELTATLAQVKTAQDTAQKAAQAAHDAQEQRYKDLANAADKDHASALADAQSATDHYIASHRVQQCPASGAVSPAPARTSGGSAGVSASLPASSVVVDDTDVHACSDLYVYSVKAHDWAAMLALPLPQ